MNPRTDLTVPVEDATAAYAAVRDLNHSTIGRAIPAPTAYGVLGNLKLLGHGLAQALTQLGDGLAASLDTFDVYEDDGRDPRENVRAARHYLAEAAGHTQSLGHLLEQAQGAINRQGYNTAGDQ